MGPTPQTLCYANTVSSSQTLLLIWACIVGHPANLVANAGESTVWSYPNAMGNKGATFAL